MIDTILIVSLIVLLVWAFWPLPGGSIFTDLAWRAFAWFVSRERIAAYLIKRAMRTPYTEIPGYMKRYWLFNPYDKVHGNEVAPIRWLPSIRVHHILRRDNDRHLHDHPWNARTVILKGYYTEVRIDDENYMRLRGYTGPINHGEYHAITSVSDGGVWTLFITFGYLSTWGFLVDGQKVPWRDYMDRYPEKPWAQDDKDSQ